MLWRHGRLELDEGQGDPLTLHPSRADAVPDLDRVDL